MAHLSARDEKVEMDMTPMIDVTFQLLIFFIITMKFRTLEKKLESHLPTDFGLQASQPVEENFVELKLRQVSDDPRVSLREQRTQYYVGKEALTLDELSAEVRRLRSKMEDPVAKIDVGRGVPHSRVVALMDVLKNADYSRISYVGIAAFRDLNAAMTQFEAMRRELSTTSR